MNNPNTSHGFPIYSLILINDGAHRTWIRICSTESSYHLNDSWEKKYKYKKNTFHLYARFGTLKCEKIYFASPAEYVHVDYKMLEFKLKN